MKRNNCEKVHINVKKEHTYEIEQKIGEQIIYGITYGWGDMKFRGKCKGKCRVLYIVLLDCDCKPIWSSVTSTKQ